MKSALILALALTTAARCVAAGAAAPVQLRTDHPMLGAWQYTSDAGCVETWRIDRGGTALITSADEVAQMRFTLTDQPSARGYFKWTDTLFKDNGKKDCSGNVTKAPRSTTSFVMMNATADRFIFCLAEDGKQCYGPWVKLEGGDI